MNLAHHVITTHQRRFNMREFNRETRHTFTTQELIDLAFEWCHNPQINTNNEDPHLMMIGFLMNIENEMGELYSAEDLIEKLKEEPLIFNDHKLHRAYGNAKWHFILEDDFDINEETIRDGVLEGFEVFFKTDIERIQLKIDLLDAVSDISFENKRRKM